MVRIISITPMKWRCCLDFRDEILAILVKSVALKALQMLIFFIKEM